VSILSSEALTPKAKPAAAAAGTRSGEGGAVGRVSAGGVRDSHPAQRRRAASRRGRYLAELIHALRNPRY
jgi:hypothetical protein